MTQIIQNKKIILASASPRRRELLEQIGISFTVLPGKGEEHITCTVPEEIVRELAEGKAKEVFEVLQEESQGLKEDFLVIGADTIVAHNGRIMGKPKDEEDAVSMLKELSSAVHEVYTGVAFFWQQDGVVQSHVFSECTQVSTYPIAEKEIRAYVETKDPMDKAGAYGIQGRFAAFIEKIDGDYNNVVGLPAGRVYQELKKKGFIGK